MNNPSRQVVFNFTRVIYKLRLTGKTFNIVNHVHLSVELCDLYDCYDKGYKHEGSEQ